MSRHVLLALVAVAPLAVGLVDPTTEGHQSQQVDYIPEADQIVDWQSVGQAQLLLNVGADKSYLITLDGPCIELGVARQVSISSANNRIVPGFDHIRADQRRCTIEQIHKL